MVWQRTVVRVSATSEKFALQTLANVANKQASLLEEEAVDRIDTAILDETAVTMSVQQNSGNTTIEIFKENGSHDLPIFKNGRS